MDERAFNLFTALLALILIVLTSVLVSSMIQSESNTKTVISKLVNQSKLESMSRLIRADAFQTFNYTTREKIEHWLSSPDNQVIIYEREKWADWDLIVDEFANDKFRNADAFAKFLGDNLPNSITEYDDRYAGSYEIKVDFDSQSFIAAVKEVLEKSSDDDDFFEIIDCDGTPEGCPNGSFYLNLKFSQISQDLYEKMPMVTVRDSRSGRELKDPVIPRNDLKIYMPIRIFRALATTRGLMHSELEPMKMNSQDDIGFLSPRFHNELDQMALGFCDYGYCAPRENPYFPPEKKGLDSKPCPGFIGTTSVKVEGEFRGLPFEYTAGNTRDMESNLADAVERRLCELSRELLLPLDDPEFEIESKLFKGEHCYISKREIEQNTTPSKKIMIAGTQPLNTLGTGPIYTVDHEPNHFEQSIVLCPNNLFLMEQRRIGLYDDAGIKAPSSLGAEVCSGFNVTGADRDFLASCNTTGRGSWACCSEISQVTLLVVFKENNPRYKIVKNRDVQFTIGIRDRTFTPFNPNHDFVTYGDPSCALGYDSRNGSCDKTGWTCYIPTSGTGCYPPTGV